MMRKKYIFKLRICAGKILLFMFLLILFTLAPIPMVYASEGGNADKNSGVHDSDIEFGDIQEVVNNLMGSNENFNFEEYVSNLLTGKEKFSFKNILNDIKTGITREINNNLGTLRSLITIIIIAAVFTNLSHAFQNTQVSETGFYVAYLLLFSILTVSFITVSDLAADTLSDVITFMKVLIPSYFLSVAFCSSASTSLVYYEATLFLITFVDILLIKILIPMINVYLLICLANNLSKEDLLSKLAELIATVTKWLLKTLFAFVIGFNTIQGLILPVADRVKKSALLKVASAIPGLGDVFGSVTESVLGAGILLKNAVGVAGVVVIVIVCAVPIIKIAITALIYRVSSAVVQPISDKRMLNCVSATAEAAGLLLQTLCIGAFLFLLTIVIVATSTS